MVCQAVVQQRGQLLRPRWGGVEAWPLLARVRGLGFKGFRVLGFRVLGFRVLGFRV